MLNKVKRKNLLIHASEAGIATVISCLDFDLISKRFNIFYDLHGVAKRYLSNNNDLDLKSTGEVPNISIFGYDKSSIDITSDFLDKLPVDTYKIGVLDTWKGLERFWYDNEELRVMPDKLLVPLPSIKEFLSNSEKYGKGTRCMSNCTEGKIPVVTINYELKDFNPPLSTKRDLAGDNGSSGTSLVSVEEKIYSETCSACHANDALGAPVLGDKDAWSEVLKKGVDVVQKNALNGINGMPPKGGNMDLTDEQLKSVVNFMIQSSK